MSAKTYRILSFRPHIWAPYVTTFLCPIQLHDLMQSYYNLATILQILYSLKFFWNVLIWN